ncbi:MAG: sulfotransferase domain-containing protein [Pseudomonadota bacterium]
MSRPDFLIIGAMKCGTSTLQAQLAAQQGIFMTEPKEPNFFSNDEVFAQGIGWYRRLYAGAESSDLTGEASTHYTKLPTYPETISRLAEETTAPRLVYVIRDPFDRLVSHYIHEWTMGVMAGSLDEAVEAHPELVAYSRYAMQIRPWIAHFGAEAVCLSSLEQIKADPDGELARVAAHIGFAGTPRWQEQSAQMNASAERIRRFALYDLLVDNPAATWLRRTLVPQGLRDAVKGRLQMKDRPELSAAKRAELAEIFRADFADLREIFSDNAALEAAAKASAL